MPERRLPMRQIKEVLRLHFEAHLSERQIARATCLSRTSVQRYLERAHACQLSWPLPQDWDEDQLERMLFPAAPSPVSPPKAVPDFAEIHRELKARKDVTLHLLWREFSEQNPNGPHYSWFCQQYREWAAHLDVVLRQQHHPGEKLFVDHAGDPVSITDPATGQTYPAWVFVAVLGASNYTFAEATLTRGLPDWIGSHSRALAFLGGAPLIVVPDQWKAGVNQPCYWDPELNRTYQDWAIHNGLAIIPARPRRARDKAKVEQGVLLVQRWILAALRKRRFFSLAELNQAIAELLTKLNQRPFRKLPGQTRASLFESLDRPALQPLPVQAYGFAEWSKTRVRLDYHFELDNHFYSVPYQLVHQQVEIRRTPTLVEVIHRGKRVASHARQARPGMTTDPVHQPKSHQRYREWTPTKLLEWATATGPHTLAMAENMMKLRPHPEAGFRAASGLRPLGKQYGLDRLEAACGRAVHFQLFRLANVRSILAKRLDQQPPPQTPAAPPFNHDNIRGADYFDQEAAR